MKIRNFISPKFNTSKLPSIKCKAVICGISVTPNDDDKDLCVVKMKFLLISPQLDQASIYEHMFSNWSLAGVESAIDCLKCSDEPGFLITNDEIEDFYGLLGTVFNAEIHYSAYDSEITSELGLINVVALPDY